jgi:hypothetical protein
VVQASDSDLVRKGPEEAKKSIINSINWIALTRRVGWGLSVCVLMSATVHNLPSKTPSWAFVKTVETEHWRGFATGPLVTPRRFRSTPYAAIAIRNGPRQPTR